MLIRRRNNPSNALRCKYNPKRCGAQLVEFAVVVPVLFLFVFGLVEIGRGFMTAHLLSNAARVGCRVGIISGQSTSDIETKTKAVLAKQGISNVSVTVKVNDQTADASTAKAGDEITVFVSVPVEEITWAPGVGYLTGSIGGQYSLRRE